MALAKTPVAKAQAAFEANFKRVVAWDAPEDRPWWMAPNGQPYDEHIRVGASVREVLTGFPSCPRGETLFWRVPIEVKKGSGGRFRSYARFAVE